MAPELTVEISDAESYFANRLYADTWGSRSSTDKQKAVVWASKMLDGAFTFSDDAYSVEDNVVTWHPQIIAAVCEQAAWCLAIDPTKYPKLLTLGISEGNAGASGKFDKSFIAPLICEAAKTLVGDLGTLNNGDGMVKSMFLGGL